MNLCILDFDNLDKRISELNYPVPNNWMLCRLAAIAMGLTNSDRVFCIIKDSGKTDQRTAAFLGRFNIRILDSIPDMRQEKVWCYLGHHSDLLEMQIKPWTPVMEPDSSFTNIVRISYKDITARWGTSLSSAKEVYQLSKVLPRNVAIRIISRLGSINEAKKNLKRIQLIAHRKIVEDLKVEDICLSTLQSPCLVTPADAAAESHELDSLLPVIVPLEEKIKKQTERSYTLIDSQLTLESLSEELATEGMLAVDTETTGLNVLKDNLVGISLSSQAGQAYYIPVSEISSCTFYTNLEKILCRNTPKKVMHNAAFDLEVLANNGFDVLGLDFDTMLAAYVLSEPKVGLKALAKSRLNLDMTTFEDLKGESETIEAVPPEMTSPYACADADSTYRLWELFSEELLKNPILNELFELEMRVMHILRSMTRHGFHIDSAKLKKIDKEFEKKIKEAAEEVYALSSREFNIDSVPQLNKVLFDELGLKRTRTTETGLNTTARLALEGLINDHEIISRILYYRRISDLKEHMQRILGVINPITGSIHPDWKQAVTRTGRLSCSPNLMNIPVPGDDEYGEVGRLMRSAFIASKSDRKLVGSDFSQLEPRLMAHFSEDAGLIAGYNRGDFDIYTYVASVVNGVSEDTVTPDQRQKTKPAVLGSNYGLTAYGYSIRAKIPKEEGERFIATYFEKFPGIQRFHTDVVNKARLNGYAETIKGRRRYFYNLDSSNDRLRSAEERECINMPIQGTAADIVKAAMDVVDEKIRYEGLDAWFVSQVHDEIILDSHERDAERVADILDETLPYVVELKVPLEVTTKIGNNWSEIH